MLLLTGIYDVISRCSVTTNNQSTPGEEVNLNFNIENFENLLQKIHIQRIRLMGRYGIKKKAWQVAALLYISLNSVLRKLYKFCELQKKLLLSKCYT